MKSYLIIANLLILISIGFCTESLGQPKRETHIKTIINGKVWVPTTSVTLGKQFFLDKMNIKGSFLYKGIRFNNIEFAYDLSKETIILSIETENKTKRNIVINPYYLEGFTVNDLSSNYDFLRGGMLHKKLDSLHYYQVVKFPNLQYVIKRGKLPTFTSNLPNRYEYLDNNSLYLISENQLISIRGKKDILNLFPGQKKEMKRFIRSNKLKIGSKTPMDAVPLLLKFDL